MVFTMKSGSSRYFMVKSVFPDQHVLPTNCSWEGDIAGGVALAIGQNCLPCE